MKLFLLERGNHHYHPLALELRHALGTSELFELDRETQQQFLPLVGEHDGTASEKYGSLHLRALGEELLRMLELELEIVFVRVRAEPDFLDDYLGSILLHLLGFLLLLVEILLVIKYFTYRRVCLSADLNKIKVHPVSHLHGRRKGIYAGFGDVVSYKANLRSCNLLIDVEFILTLGLTSLGVSLSGRPCPGRLWSSRRPRAAEMWFVRRCDKKYLL